MTDINIEQLMKNLEKLSEAHNVLLDYNFVFQAHVIAEIINKIINDNSSNLQIKTKLLEAVQ